MSTNSLMNEQAQIDKSSARLVWVLNNDIKAYKAVYRTHSIVIPPNRQKIAKRAENGGNLMNYLEARRFIVDYKEPQDYVMDAGGKATPTYGYKALIDEELTQSEFDQIVGKSAAQIEKEVVSDEKKAKRILTANLKKVTNKVSLEDETEA